MQTNSSASCVEWDDGDDAELVERALDSAQRELDRTFSAHSEALSDYRSFLSEGAARENLNFSQFRHLTYRELWETQTGFVQWVLGVPAERTDGVQLRKLRKWLEVTGALERRWIRCVHEKENAELLARAFDLKPTELLRKSTARGQLLCKLSEDTLDCVVRSLEHLRTYRRLACTCKTVSQALRPMRVDHVVALGLNRFPATAPVNIVAYKMVRRLLGVPPYLRIKGGAEEMTRVGRLMERGLRQELEGLATQMEKQVAEHTRRRANLRRATTAVEYTTCSDKRLTEAAGLVRKALADVECTTSRFTELCARSRLRYSDVPTVRICSEETMSIWLKFMRRILVRQTLHGSHRD